MLFPTRESWSWKTDTKCRSTHWAEAGVRLGRPTDSRAKTSWKVLALNYSVTIVIHPNVRFISRKRDVNSAQSAHFWTGRLRNNPNKRPKKGGDRSAVAIVTSVRQLGCVSQDAEPPESVTISRKGTQVLGPIRRPRFTTATLRQASIRESKGPSLSKIQVKSSHQRSPNAVKFDDGSQEKDRKTRAMRPRRRV